jgi:hypothetical protein
MAVPAVLEARQRLGATRTASSLPAVASDYVERPVRQWPWTLATVAILLLIVAACARVAL